MLLTLLLPSGSGAVGTSALNPLGIGAIPGDGTGDEPRAGFTKVKCDHATFLSSIGRRQTNAGTFGSTSSTGSTTVLNDATQTWAVNQFAGQTLTIQSGPLEGYSQTISGNSASAITVAAAFLSAIGSGVRYQVSASIANSGSDGFATTLGATSPSTLVDANQAWTVNAWAGQGVTLLAGAYAGQTSPIVSNTATALTLSVAFASAIAAGTPYAIGPLPIMLNFSSTVSATLGTTANNLAPTSWGPGIDRLRLAAAAGGSTVTGLSAAGISDGAQVILRNTSASNMLTLDHLSTSSTAANQFSLPGGLNFSLPPLTSCALIYDISEPNSSGTGAWTLLP